MGALSAAKAPATFDSSAYLGALLMERTQGRMARDRDRANEAFRRAVRERVRSRRGELGYSRDRMAQLLGVTFNAYAKWEREGVPLDRLSSLAEVLGVSPEWILHGDAPALADLQRQVEDLAEWVRRLAPLAAPPEAERESTR